MIRDRWWYEFKTDKYLTTQQELQVLMYHGEAAFFTKRMDKLLKVTNKFQDDSSLIASSSAHFLMSRLRSFPSVFLGTLWRISTRPLIFLKSALTLELTKVLMSSSVTGRWPSLKTTTADISSWTDGSLIPKTRHSFTAGWDCKISSNSVGATWLLQYLLKK